jgi:hypothetical protein
MQWLGLVILFSAFNNTHRSLCGKTSLCPLLHVRHRTRVTTTNKIKRTSDVWRCFRLRICINGYLSCGIKRSPLNGTLRCPRAYISPCIYVYVTFYELYCVSSADHSGRAFWGMNCLRSLERWDRGFESRLRHRSLCAFILCLCCCV